ncbi:hypothetical protein BON22_4097 [Cyberlindnera fabianii]|uniref:Uncharacterized protein n=1 Tax=Cyberlindnera fabianii TaxID=36022 RepID=A0A1V2L2T5_CYBFA|nr:hypothetical protein BON22_4097 [Cyberlindnera fabianii]
MQVGEPDGNAADALVGIKRAPSFSGIHRASFNSQGNRMSVSEQQRMGSVGSAVNTNIDLGEEHVQKVYLHRRTHLNQDPRVQYTESHLREQDHGRPSKENNADTVKENSAAEDNVLDRLHTDVKIEEKDGDESMPDATAAILPTDIPFSAADIIFANGNNREKRRVEFFDYYSKLYKFKESHRSDIYHHEKKLLEDRLAALSKPRTFLSEVATLEESGDKLLYELEQDIVETRDFELTRLKHWRRFQRNENLRSYYYDSSKVYKEATEQLDRRLDKLKNFFVKQKALLSNLDRDMGDIGSARATRLYSGFVGKENIGDDEVVPENERYKTTEKGPSMGNTSSGESSETDTGASSSGHQMSGASSGRGGWRGRGRRGRGGWRGGPRGGRGGAKATQSRSSSTVPSSVPEMKLLNSIVDGFAPILTQEEFAAVVGDDTLSREGHGALILGRRGEGASDSESNTDTASDKKRPYYGRGRGEKDTTAMNKIMKTYLPPDDLKPEEVEDDLALIRSLKT